MTDQQENQRISWRDLGGSLQSTRVTFQPLPNNQTEVRLRLEATPPEGMDRQQLDRLTYSTSRSLKRGLKTFASQMRGEGEVGVAGMSRTSVAHWRWALDSHRSNHPGRYRVLCLSAPALSIRAALRKAPAWGGRGGAALPRSEPPARQPAVPSSSVFLRL